MTSSMTSVAVILLHGKLMASGPSTPLPFVILTALTVTGSVVFAPSNASGASSDCASGNGLEELMVTGREREKVPASTRILHGTSDSVLYRCTLPVTPESTRESDGAAMKLIWG